MTAEVISIGSELTCGKSLDTNARWISLRLSEVGIDVGYHTTVMDDFEANVAAFRTAGNRADLVIATGGLGPTADDLTRQAVSAYADLPMELDQPSLDHIEQLFAQRNRPMPERNRVQALFPRSSVVIPNNQGTAPGIWLEHQGTVVVCMPGVPSEMYAMFTDWVLPRLGERFGTGRAIVHHTLRCFGAGESHIEEMLGDLTARGRHPEVGITASEATISLRVTAAADSAEQARALIAPDVLRIRETLGDLVYGEEDDTLQSVVARLLAERNVTLATAESCTGGLVGHLITEVPGVSAHYLGGVVSYSNEAKMKFLGVNEETLAQHGAVSPETASEMARGCRTAFGADLGIGVTGVAGPSGGTPEKPVGLVYIALAHADGVKTAKYNWNAPRSTTKLRSAKTALNLIRRHLLT